MNKFDSSITLFLNSFAQVSPFFDSIMIMFAKSNTLKGGVMMTCICWLWFQVDEQREIKRKQLLATILSSFAAIVIARILVMTLPFRERPLHEAGLNFVLPFGMDTGVLDGWSSFPSDHAVMFFSLSFGLLFTARKMGLFALVYSTLFIAFPRMYLGLHYATDILAGALLGMAIAWIGNLSFLTNRISKSLMPWIDRKPQLFYTLFFFVIYQIADLFNGSRELAVTCYKLLKILL